MARTFKPRTYQVKITGKDLLPVDLHADHDAANYIQHIILTHKAQGMTIKPHYHQEPNGGYYRHEHPEHVALTRNTLDDVLGDRRCKRVLDYMIGNGHLETTHFQQGVHAKGYKLSDNLLSLPTKKIKVESEWLLRSLFAYEHANMKHWTKTHFHLRNWTKKFSSNVSRMAELVLSHPNKDDLRVVMEMLRDGDYNWTVCKQGRFHSVFTCLASILRGCLEYQCVPLVNVDISNSQPFLLGSLVASNLPSFSSPNSPPLTPPFLPIPSILPTLASENVCKSYTGQALTQDELLPQTHPEIPQDLEHYMGLCQQGKLYQYLMHRIDWEGSVNDFKDDVWFGFLYGSNKSLERYQSDPDLKPMLPLIRAFSKDFPSVYKYLWEEKVKNYKRVPCQMQKLESDIMILGVCGKLANQYPQVPVITIHDSIMTTPEHVELVKRLIKEEFVSRGFLEPNLKETNYGDVNVKG